MSKISELSDGGSLVSSDYLIAVRSGGNVKVRMDQINVDQVDLGDNEFIRLGNSQDLTMVHTSTQSIINQAGIGDLLLQKAGATKLTINATGIDVTGSVTADGLTVDGSAVIQSGNTLTLNRTDNATGGAMSYVAGTGFIFNDANGDGTSFNVGATNRMRIDSSGNLGIGCSPTMPLDVAGACSDGGNTGANVNQTLYDTTSYALGVGGGIGFAGKAGSGSNLFDVMFATINGIKENATNANYSSALTFKTRVSGSGLTERMRIDSSGNVGIGVVPNAGWNSTYKAIQVGNAGAVWSEDASSSNTLISNNEVYNTNGSYYRLVAGAANDILLQNNGSFQFRSTATSAAANSIISDQTTKMTLDASGNLLVGKTANDNTTAGHRFTASGFTAHVIANDYPLLLNRLSSDGALLTLRKDSTTVGSISASTNLNIGSGETRIWFRDGTKALRPVSTEVGNGSDGIISIGEASGGRFKDLYLSGGVYLGGTAAANKLDDYEEGTWTPAQGSGLTVSGAFSSSGTYTKIGRMVYVKGFVGGATSVSCSQNGQICTGLTFAPISGENAGISMDDGRTASRACSALSTSVVQNTSAIPSTVYGISFAITYQTS